jgi:hypothetical protein
MRTHVRARTRTRLNACLLAHCAGPSRRGSRRATLPHAQAQRARTQPNASLPAPCEPRDRSNRRMPTGRLAQTAEPRERLGVPARRFRAANVLSAIKACTELGVDDAVLIEPADLLEGRGTIRQPQRQHTYGAQRTNIGATVPRCGGHHAAPHIRAAVARHVGSTHLCGLDRKSIDSSTAQGPLRAPVRAVCTFGYVQSMLMRSARCAQAEWLRWSTRSGLLYVPCRWHAVGQVCVT